MTAAKVHLFKRLKTLTNGKRIHYWTLRWRDNRGRSRHESVGCVGDMTRSKAESIRREKLIDISSGKISRDRPTKMTLSQFLEQDRQAIKSDVKRATIVTHEGVGNHAVTAMGDIELAKVDWSDVSRLKNWLGSEHVLNKKKFPPCSKATIRKTIVTLKAAFGRAIKRGLISSNPFADERLAKIQPKQKRIYSHEETAAMVETTADIWWQTFIRLGFTTGLRVGELLNLTWPDIDEPNGQVIVSAKRAAACC